MPITGNVSLYFHIPFCTKKCPYCHFYVIPDKALHKKLYLEALQKECTLKFPLLKNKSICSLYFGGGTPSLFPEAVAATLEKVHKEKLQLTPDAEITLEANPEDITPELSRQCAAMGINRVSMGVQSLSDHSLKKLGRSHDSAKACEAVNLLLEAGISNISIDLMYDLPSQTIACWEDTLARAASLPITHLSLYNLTLEPHTVFFKKRKELMPTLPSPEASLQMLQQAVAILESNGLKRYEISAFAREGAAARHNTGYWTGRPFLGFGPSAFSYWEKKRFRNAPNLWRYARALEEGRDPMDFSEQLGEEEQQKELFAVALRLLEGIDMDHFQKRQGVLTRDLVHSLETLEKEGLISLTGSRAALTEKGLLFYDTVAEMII